MKKWRLYLPPVILTTLLLVVSLVGCSSNSTEKIKVVTSTSLLAQIVDRIGTENINVVNIIPPSQCPGHFDVKPGDIQKLADAKLFIIHNWQGEKFSEDLIASANNNNLKTVKIELAGNWMTPPVQTAAVDKIAETLGQIDPGNTDKYQEAAALYKSKITDKEAILKSALAGKNLAEINVLCDEQQAGFVKWAGLNIIASYGRPETFTPQVTKDLIDKGRGQKVTLVIDNMQTGGESGKSLAQELGVKHIVLSNFPGGYDDTETWEKAIEKNIELILAAVAE